MGIFDIFKGSGSKEKVSGDSVEFPEDSEPREQLTVRIENIGGLQDVEKAAMLLRKGTVLLLKIKDIQRRDIGLAQTALQKLKRLSTQFNWDLVALPEGYLIMTPNFAKIERPESSITPVE